MASSHEKIVRLEDGEGDSLESEDSLRERTTVTAIGKVREIEFVIFVEFGVRTLLSNDFQLHLISVSIFVRMEHEGLFE